MSQLLIYFVASCILTSIACLFFGGFVYLRGKRNPINISWALFSFCEALWAFGLGMMSCAPTVSEARFWLSNVHYLGATAIPCFFLHFVLAVLGLVRRRRLLLSVVYVLTLFLEYTNLSGQLADVRPWSTFTFYTTAGPFYWLFTALFFAVVFYTHLLLFIYAKRTTGDLRERIKWLFVGMAIGFSCGSTAFFPVFEIPVFPFGVPFTFLHIAIMSYAIVRHQLMDIQLVVRRSVIYSILIACITALYLVMVLVMEKWFQGFFGYRSLVATTFVAFLIAVFFDPLRSRIQTFVDKALFKATPAELAVQREQLLEEVRKTEQHKAVATLTAGLAHEIKNPLASIKTFTDYLAQRHDDPAFRERFQTIVGGEVERINLIVQQLLEFAKPTPPKLSPTRIKKVIDETLELLNSELLLCRKALIKGVECS